MSYRHINALERQLIEQMFAAAHSCRQIAKFLGRSPSTISREIVWNVQSVEHGYRADEAEAMARHRLHKARSEPRLNAPELRAAVVALLDRHWSPQIIQYRLKQDYPDNASMRISHESIYQWL